MNKSKTILIIFILLLLQSNSGRSWNEYQTGEIDTILFQDYAIFLYLGKCNTMNVISGIEITRDDETMILREDCEVWFYHFCQNENDYSMDCLFRDLNSDGSPEVIINDYWGGQGCCHDVYIYSLGDSAKMIDLVGSESAGGILEDIDGDSIPEFICSDQSFKWWKAHKVSSPKPILIWKWNGEKYKIANFQFGQYILDKESNNYYEEFMRYSKYPEDVRYDPDKEIPDFPPPELWGKVLTYFYAGKPEMADSVFNASWPDNIPGKELFYRDLKERLSKGKYWREIQDSDW